MKRTKATTALGILIALALMGLAALKYNGFSEVKGGGVWYFWVTIAAAALAGLAIMYRPNFESEKFKPRIYTIWVYLVLFIAPLFMTVVVERLNDNFLWTMTNNMVWTDNWFVCLLFYLLIFGITGSVRAAVFTMSPFFLAFGVANMYVKEFKGSPLVPIDAGSVSTAMSVATRYKYDIGADIVFGVVMTVLIIAIAAPLKMPERKKWHRILVRVVPLVFVIAVAGVFYLTDIPAEYGLKPDFFNQTRGYEAKGAMREFMVNTRYMRHKAPEGYNASKVPSIIRSGAEGEVPDILETAETLYGGLGQDAGAPEQGRTGAQSGSGTASIAASPEKPDIIVVMNEAFSDLRVLGDFETTEDVMPFIDSLSENTIKGHSYVSVIGTGTSNTEYEFLTQNTMTFLPPGSNAYQLYVRNKQPGLVSTLESLGYYAETLHPYFRDNWNRPAVYDLMGFEKFTSIEDIFQGLDVGSYPSTGENFTGFNMALRKLFPDEKIMVERSVSDHYDYKKLIELYEARDKSKPYFNFNITMQNHSPYDTNGGFYKKRLELTSPKLEDGKTFTMAEKYLSYIKDSDDAFHELIDYFSKVDRPVIVLMFGDHQPNLENGFYSEVYGKPVSDWTDADRQNKYISKFVLWANYDIPEGEVDKISVNYLQTMLLQIAGLPMTDYNKYMASLYTKYPVITAQGCIDASGNFFMADDAEGQAKQDILDYAAACYNNLTDFENRDDEAFYLNATP